MLVETFIDVGQFFSKDKLSMHVLGYFLHLVAAVGGVAIIFKVFSSCGLPACPTVLARGGILISVATLGILSFKVSTPPDRFHDFVTAYLPAGQAALRSNYDALHTTMGQGVSGFVNMPVIAYLFAPFAFEGPRTAIVLFTVVGLGLTVASWFILVRLARLDVREQWLLALLFVVSGPLMNGIKLGNTSYMVLFNLAAGLVFLQRQRSASAGALLGLAAMLKPPLLLFAIFFALRRDLPGILGFSVVCATIATLSFALFGPAENLYWFHTSIVAYSHGWLSAFNVQSIPAFLLRLHADVNLADWHLHRPAPVENRIAELATALIFLIAGVACIRHPAAVYVRAIAYERLNLQYLLVICLCIISSPLTWSHYYVWLFIPTAFFLGTRRTVPAPRGARALGWIAIVLTIPLVEWPWSISNPVLMGLYRSFAISHLLFGGLLWFGIIAWWLATTGGLLWSSGRPSANFIQSPYPEDLRGQTG